MFLYCTCGKECRWATGALTHGVVRRDGQEVFLATAELGNVCRSVVGAELHYVAAVGLCSYHVDLCSLTGIPGDRTHLQVTIE